MSCSGEGRRPAAPGPGMKASDKNPIKSSCYTWMQAHPRINACSQRARIRTKDDVSPRLDFNTSSFSLNDTITLEAVLFTKRSFFSPVILSIMTLPVILHVPLTVPGTTG